MVGGSAPAAVVERVRHDWDMTSRCRSSTSRSCEKAVTGDFGTSLRTRRPVSQDIAQFGPATLELALWTAPRAVLALILGTWAASGRAGSGTPSGRHECAGSAPTFAVALFLLIVLYKQLGLFPPGARLSDGINSWADRPVRLRWHHPARFSEEPDALWHLVIPCMCLALVPAVAIARVLHGSLDTVMREDFVRTARSKGLTVGGVVLNHGLRNASGPSLSMAGLQFGALLTGVVIIERCCRGQARPVRQPGDRGCRFPGDHSRRSSLGVAYVWCNFIVDFLQLGADPRFGPAS